MPTALVTGPTGFVGAGLVDALLSRGYHVRAYARPAWKGRELPVPAGHPDGGPSRPGALETFYGDVRDPDALARAASGCDLVFHTAAIVSFRKGDRDEQLAVNVGGAKAVADACLRAGVGRLVHTSSIAALGTRDDGGLIDESVPFNWPHSVTYRYSKHLGEMEVLAAVRRGLDAVVVNPSVIVGPGDRYVHGGQYVRDGSRGKLFAYPIGGVNMVGVSDVVAGHIAAAERGRAGERYILGGVNLTHREAFSLVASIVGGRRPRLPVPRAGVLAVAAAAELLAALTRTEPIVTRDLVAGVGRYQWYSIAKARAELGYNPLSLEKSLRDAYIWYRDNNLL
jgi:dihydroflavonol-4-reductase